MANRRKSAVLAIFLHTKQQKTSQRTPGVQDLTCIRVQQALDEDEESRLNKGKGGPRIIEFGRSLNSSQRTPYINLRRQRRKKELPRKDSRTCWRG